MKRFSRVVSFALSVCMLIGLAVPASAANKGTSSEPFTVSSKSLTAYSMASSGRFALGKTGSNLSNSYVETNTTGVSRLTAQNVTANSLVVGEGEYVELSVDLPTSIIGTGTLTYNVGEGKEMVEGKPQSESTGVSFNNLVVVEGKTAPIKGYFHSVSGKVKPVGDVTLDGTYTVVGAANENDAKNVTVNGNAIISGYFKKLTVNSSAAVTVIDSTVIGTIDQKAGSNITVNKGVALTVDGSMMQPVEAQTITHWSKNNSGYYLLPAGSYTTLSGSWELDGDTAVKDTGADELSAALGGNSLTIYGGTVKASNGTVIGVDGKASLSTIGDGVKAYGDFKQISMPKVNDVSYPITVPANKSISAEYQGGVNSVTVKQDTVFPAWDGVLPAGTNYEYENISGSWEGKTPEQSQTISVTYIGKGNSLTITQDNAAVKGTFSELNTGSHVVTVVGDLTVEKGSVKLKGTEGVSLTVRSGEGSITGSFKDIDLTGATAASKYDINVTEAESLAIESCDAAIAGSFTDITIADSTFTISDATTAELLTVTNSAVAEECFINGSFEEIVINDGKFHINSKAEATLTVNDGDGVITGIYYKLKINGGKVADDTGDSNKVIINHAMANVKESAIEVKDGDLTLSNNPSITVNSDNTTAVDVTGGKMTVKNGSIAAIGVATKAISVSNGGELVLGDPEFDDSEIPSVMTSGGESIALYINNKGYATVYRGDIRFDDESSRGIRVTYGGHVNLYPNDEFGTAHPYGQDEPHIHIYGGKNASAAMWIDTNASFEIRGRGALIEEPNSNADSYALYISSGANVNDSILAGGTFNGKIYWDGDDSESFVNHLIESNHYVRFEGNSPYFGWSDGTWGISPRTESERDIIGGFSEFHDEEDEENEFDGKYTNTLGKKGEYYSIIDAEHELRYAMANNCNYQIPAGIILQLYDESRYGYPNIGIELDKNDPAEWGNDKRQGDLNIKGESTLYLAGRRINYNVDYDYTNADLVNLQEGESDKLRTIALVDANSKLTIVSAVYEGEGTDAARSAKEGGYVSLGGVSYKGFFTALGDADSSAVYVENGELTVKSGILNGGESAIYTTGGKTAIGTASENVSDDVILSYAKDQAIRVAGGEVILNGGSNVSYQDGVLVEDGNLTVNGGLIAGHNQYTGSGIHTTGGTVAIHGGAIYGNYNDAADKISAKGDESGRSIVMDDGVVTVAIDEAHRSYVEDFTRETEQLHHIHNILVNGGTLNYGVKGEDNAHNRNNGALTVSGGTVNYYDGVTAGETVVYGKEHTVLDDFTTRFYVEDGDFGTFKVTGFDDDNTVAYQADSFHDSVQLHGGYYAGIETDVLLETGETTVEDILGAWKTAKYDGTTEEARHVNHYAEEVASARSERGEWDRNNTIQSGIGRTGETAVTAGEEKAISVRNAIKEFKAWAEGADNETYTLYTNLWVGDAVCNEEFCDAQNEAPVDIKRTGATLKLNEFGIYGDKADHSILAVSGSAVVEGAAQSEIRNLTGNAVAVKTDGELTLDQGAAVIGSSAVTNNGTLTVKEAAVSGQTALVNNGAATVNEGAQITGTDGNGISTSGTLTMNGGTVTGTTNGLDKTGGTATLNGGTVSSIKTNGTISELLGEGLTLSDVNGVLAGADVVTRSSVKDGDSSGDAATGGDSVRYDGDKLSAVAYDTKLAANFTVVEKSFGEIRLTANNKVTLAVENAVKAALDKAIVTDGSATVYLDKSGSADIKITPVAGNGISSVKLNGKEVVTLWGKRIAAVKVSAADISVDAEGKPFEVAINAEDSVAVKPNGSFTYTVTGESLEKPTVQRMDDDGRWVTFADAEITEQDGGYTVALGIAKLDSNYRINAFKVHFAAPAVPKTYAITTVETENGKIETSAKSKSAGDSVELTLTPNDGCMLVSAEVIDEKGNAVEVRTENGKRVFTMPASNVTAKATFTEKVSHIFNDVTETDWFDSAVQYCYDNGLIKGTQKTLFSPSLNTTRSMIVAILYRLEKEPDVTAAVDFTDVANGAWYEESVAWAQENKIVNGYPNGSFGVEDYISREQLAAILYRYATYKGYDTTAQADISTYADASEVSSWATAAIEWANANGYINGYGKKLNPKGYATRAETAAIIYRFSAARLAK